MTDLSDFTSEERFTPLPKHDFSDTSNTTTIRKHRTCRYLIFSDPDFKKATMRYSSRIAEDLTINLSGMLSQPLASKIMATSLEAIYSHSHHVLLS